MIQTIPLLYSYINFTIKNSQKDTTYSYQLTHGVPKFDSDKIKGIHSKNKNIVFKADRGPVSVCDLFVVDSHSVFEFIKHIIFGLK